MFSVFKYFSHLTLETYKFWINKQNQFTAQPQRDKNSSSIHISCSNTMQSNTRYNH